MSKSRETRTTSKLDHAFTHDDKKVLIENSAEIIIRLDILISDNTRQIASNRLILNAPRIPENSKTIQKAIVNF